MLLKRQQNSLPIFSERTALLLKEQISTFDKCHIIAISSAVKMYFWDQTGLYKQSKNTRFSRYEISNQKDTKERVA